MKVGIVGCGDIAYAHVPFIQQSKKRQIVGICDRDRSRAEALAQRFTLGSVYTNFTQLLQEQRPDVVHVLTPPQAHKPLAIQAMQAGCHVLVEKPMATSVEEADAIIAAAKTYGTKLCVDHIQLFDPVVLQAKGLISDGVVGRIISVESYYGFNLGQVSGRRWVDDLACGMFQDVAPHPLSLVLDFLKDPLELHTSLLATGAFGRDVPDELRVLMKGTNAVGTLSISFAIKPYVNFLNIYGSKAILHLDLANMILSTERLRPLPKAAARGLMTVEQGMQLAFGAVRNAFKFILGRIKPYHAMGNLIERFYDSIERDQPVPVSGEAGRRVVEVFDRIRASFPVAIPRPIRTVRTGVPIVCVTGASGFLGSHVVEKLSQRGAEVRALVRPTSRISHLKDLDVDVIEAALNDGDTLRRAIEGADMVIHCAAATNGTWNDYVEGTIRGTERVLETSAACGVKRVVYVSSLSVYGVSHLKNRALVTEDSALDARPEDRGYYAQSKIEAEKLVLAYAQEGRLPIAILRPGLIYGPRGTIFSPSVGYALRDKLFMTIGAGDHLMPFTYVDNVIDAMWLAGTRPEAVGQVYNIVDDDLLTQQEYIHEFIKRRGLQGTHSLHVPFAFVYGAALLFEARSAISKNGSPPLTRYRLISATKDLRFDTSRAKLQLGWTPRVSFEEALARTFDWYNGELSK